MFAVPKSAVNDLLERLDALMVRGRDDLELRRIELDALSQVKKGGGLVAPYSCVLGAVYSHKFDWMKAEAYFNEAILGADDDNVIVYRLNKNSGLHNTYQISKAAELSLALFEANRDNLVVLEQAMYMARWALRFDWLENLMKNRGRLVEGEAQSLTQGEKSFVQRLKSNKISFDQVGIALDVAAVVLADEKLQRLSASVFINSEGAALYTFVADVSPQEASRLTFVMAEKVMEACAVNILDSLVFNVIPYESAAVSQ